MVILRVGDPHVKVSNLEESERLLRFIFQTVKDKNVDRLEILGDLFHTHAVVRLEVLEFWNKWLKALSDKVQTIVLVGNHDMTGDHSSKSHSLSVFKDLNPSKLIIVEEGFLALNEPVAYVAYHHDAELFVEFANHMAAQGARVLVSHQTYAGSQFDNGFYAPDGINPDLLKFDTVISGHIHKRQRFGKVIYPGTGRWDGIIDANQQKGLWLVDHDNQTGAIVNEEFIETDSVCTPIFSIQWKEGDKKPSVLETEQRAKIAVELIGSSTWVSQIKSELKGKVAIKVKITDKSRTANRQIGNSLTDFVKTVFNSTMDKEQLLEMMKELEIV